MAHPLNEIVRLLRQAQRVLVATHVNPDGDALGSQLALADALERMGKEVYRYSEEKVNYIYRFLPASDTLKTDLPAEPRAFDCAIALDCGDQYRLGKNMDRLLAIQPFLVVDHHLGHKPFGDVSWVEPGRAAAGEMVYELIQALEADLSPEAAYCLYAAIVSDTGSFRYSSTTADTFRIARELVQKGVQPAEVASRLFDNFTPNRLELLTAVLGTMELHAGSRIALITADQQMFARTGTSTADTEHFINYPRALAAVQVAAFIKETQNGHIAVSLRSKDRYDVAEVAARFGGGGHRNAAGFKLPAGSIGETWGRLLRELLPVVEGQG